MDHPNKSAADVAARAAFFTSIAHDLEQSILPPTEVVFLPSRIAPMTDAYFLLNDAYKRWRIVPNHRTKPSKIAALTCMAIMTFSPFRPLPAGQISSFKQMKANEIYSLCCALAILQNPVGMRTNFNRNLPLRLFDIFSRSAAWQTLQPLLVDINLKINRDNYSLNIHDDDKLCMDALITIFELLERQFAAAWDLASL